MIKNVSMFFGFIGLNIYIVLVSLDRLKNIRIDKTIEHYMNNNIILFIIGILIVLSTLYFVLHNIIHLWKKNNMVVKLIFYFYHFT